jgi:HlyD family secretion protein
MAEAKFAAQDIDQLRLGQTAVVRFSAFQRTTPELNGTVSRISADAVPDPRTSGAYYTVRISLAGDEISRLGEVKLIPGMPVEVFIQTGDRTVIAYLMKPLHDQASRAFRER